MIAYGKLTTDILLVMWICVFVVDLSGFRPALLGALSKWLKGPVKSLKPFTCSLCMTWWSSLVLLIVTGRFTLAGVAIAAGAAILSQPAASLAGSVLDLLNNLINKIGL